jgi:hypothetical protein
MANSSSKSKRVIQLPVQVLNWKSIKDPGNLYKIFFQFDIKLNPKGEKIYSLIAYAAYRYGKETKMFFGKKIPLSVKRPVEFFDLKLPVTLGNLELLHEDIISQVKPTEKTRLIFRPYYFKTNPHAAYQVSDEAGQGRLNAKPSPPAPPEAV